MKVYIRTHGCRLNSAESRNSAEILESYGHIIVNEIDESVKIAIINTCAVTDSAESKCMQSIRQIIKENPNISLVITGCLAEKNAENLIKIHSRTYVLGNSEKHNIAEYINFIKFDNNSSNIIKNPIKNSEFFMSCKMNGFYNKRYNLKIQDGCDYFCSYCIIPRLRGKPRSRNFTNLIEDAKMHVKNGVKEIILTGVNIGVYQNDSKNLSNIIEEINKIDGVERIRLSSIELNTISDNILSQMESSKNKLVRYLHIPIQSGSDSILHLMRRRYSISDVRKLFDNIMKNITGIGLGTDIIVGFPGETEKDFQLSFDLMQTSPLQYAHVFSYSSRDGTIASLMKDKFICKKEIYRRSKFLRDISYEKRKNFISKNLGQVKKVLFEDKESNGFPGFTESYIKVIVPENKKNLTNQICNVRLNINKGNHVIGELV